MIILVWIRYFAELCLYFGLIRVFPKAFPIDTDPIVPALILSLTITLASVVSERVHRGLRFIILTIPAAYMFHISGSKWDLIIMIPAVIYTLFVVIKDVQLPGYYEYLDIYKKVACGAGILYIVLLPAEVAFNKTRDLAGQVYSTPLLEYGIVYAVLGVVLLKALRLGSEYKKRSRIIQVRELLVPAGIIAPIGVILVLISRSFETIKELLLKGIYRLFSPAVMLVSKLSEKTAKKPWEEVVETESTTSIESEGFAAVIGLGEALPEETAEITPDRSWIFPVVLIVVLTAVMIALVVSVRKIREKAKPLTYVTESIDVTAKKKKRQLRRSNTEKIRALYRDYLQKTAARGIKIAENMTSGEIYENAVSVAEDVAAAENLRRLYLLARYNDNAKPGEEDVKFAVEAAKSVYAHK